MTRRPLLLFALASALGLTGFLFASARTHSLGFPLDDAWIHQTYARNLATTGQWAFVPGQPSAGSTSPLWTVLLAVGYRLGIEYHAWTYALGLALLVLLAWLCYRLTLALFPAHPKAAVGAGLAVALEWHLLWAAGSGMETVLFTVFAVAVLWRSVERERFPGFLGLVIGLSLFARPDGLTLLPIALLGLALQSIDQFAGRRPEQLRAATLRVGALLVGFSLAFAGYLLFNRAVGGQFWPNTFYAKQAEYAALRDAPFFLRLLREWLPPLVGGTLLLVPGILLTAFSPLRRRFAKRAGEGPGVGRFLPLLWAIAFVTLFALRLPATYQHGRYVIPVIPVLIVYGTGGMARWLKLNDSRACRGGVTPPVLVSCAWLAATVTAFGMFAVVGAQAYARDVAIIETEMVATAKWLGANTPQDSLIAAHDIGAIGYFANRQLLDMAGLVSPEVIPFIREEERLADWLDARGADYLVTFPGWYPRLVAGRAVVFTSGGQFSPPAGGENIVVLRWSK